MSLNMKDRPPRECEPAWEIARLFPHQGHWSSADYLDLAHRTNNLVELANGSIEVLPLPTRSHQLMVIHLCSLLASHLKAKRSGRVLVAPYPLRLKPEKFREPDLLVALTEHADRFGEEFAEWADLVMEVVSKDRRKDLETKRAEYAEAGIPEYWIVDPHEQRITVVAIDTAGTYAVHGVFTPGAQATSRLLAGFSVDVAAVFAAGRGED